MGVITPVGNDVQTFWQNITNGVSGIRPITHFDVSTFDCRIAGEVRDFEAVNYFKDKKGPKRSDRFVHLAVGAAKLAMQDAGFTGPVPEPERFGCIVGSGIGGLKTTEDQHTNYMNKGPSRISPFMIPMLISNMASGIVSMEWGLQGPNYSPVSACATSAHSVGEAWRLIREGEADLFAAGGREAAIVPLGIGGFAAMKALSTRNDEPAKASRPWDKDRDGFVMGEGAGIVILEELEHAKKRGARIYAEIVGYGMTADAYHMSAPLPNHEQAQRSMRIALQKAGLNASDVDYINAHGTSTPVGDVAEVRAVKAVLGEKAKHVPVSSTKSMTGHLLGAAGALEGLLTVLSVHHRIAPAAINIDDFDPKIDLDVIRGEHRTLPDGDIAALNNSFGFGGHNVALVFRSS